MTQARRISLPETEEKRSKRLREVGIVLVLIFVCQAAVLCYFNFTQLRNHMGFDSSWNFVRSALVWREKTLVSPDWSESTSLSLDTHDPLCSLLYGITGDMMLSFGIANTLMTVLLCFFMWKILARLGVRFIGKMIALNLLICPYLTNEFFVYIDLGYFSMVLSGAAQYSMRILLALMIVDEFLIILQEKRLGILAWVVWLSCLMSGFSSGVYIIVVMLLPCLVYEVEMFAIRDDWKQLIRKESIFVYICCAFVVAGKEMARIFAGYVATDGSTSWTALENLWKNFGAVIQGYLKLLQVLPVTGDVDSIVSITGLLRMFILVVFALNLIAVVSFLWRSLKNLTEKDGAMLFLVNILVINFLVFGLFNARYGALIFEERYLITAFVITMIMMAVFFDRLLSKFRAFSVFLCLVMAVSIGMVDVHSDYNYLRTTNDAWRIDAIQELAEEQDAGVVYFWGDDLTVISRTMRACDLDRVYKQIRDTGDYYHYDGDYKIYDDFDEYSGPTLMICDREDRLVPEEILAEYTLLETLDYRILGPSRQLNVYVSDHNPKMW